MHILGIYRGCYIETLVMRVVHCASINIHKQAHSANRYPDYKPHRNGGLLHLILH